MPDFSASPESLAETKQDRHVGDARSPESVRSRMDSIRVANIIASGACKGSNGCNEGPRGARRRKTHVSCPRWPRALENRLAQKDPRAIAKRAAMERNRQSAEDAQKERYDQSDSDEDWDADMRDGEVDEEEEEEEEEEGEEEEEEEEEAEGEEERFQRYRQQQRQQRGHQATPGTGKGRMSVIENAVSTLFRPKTGGTKGPSQPQMWECPRLAVFHPPR